MRILLELSFAVIIIAIVANCEENEQRLVNDLLRRNGYNRHLRPVLNQNDTIKVSMGVALLNIIDIDKDNIVLNAWLRMAWRDAYLKWDPSHYGGLSVIRVPHKWIYKPDIVLYNKGYSKHYGQTELDADDVNALVYNDGTVMFLPPVKLVARIMGGSQKTKEGYIVNADLKFGSWTFDGFKISLDYFDGKKNIDLSDYVVSNDYKVVKTTAKINVKHYSCCKEPYPDITFSLKVQKA